MHRRIVAVFVLLLAVAACGDVPLGVDDTAGPRRSIAAVDVASGAVDDAATTTTATDDGEPTESSAQPDIAPTSFLGLALEPVATGLFHPTVVTAPAGDDRLFVAERVGVIRNVGPGIAGDGVFLDLRDRVGSNGIEQGLLGVAFHPDHADNGRFFVYYVNANGNRRLSEFSVGDDPTKGDPDSEIQFFTLQQPGSEIRHYGGDIHFGPDGYLYVAIGDGADAFNQGQDPSSLFASILRLDVDGGEPYAIPADNPFVDGGGAGEVWVYGLRNPWRFAIDPVSDTMVIADVGQALWEEVNVIGLDQGGANLGWPIAEGDTCFRDPSCDRSPFVAPAVVYDHSDGCSVTGGFVYRGAAIPEIDGHYFYADWCQKWVRSFRWEDGAVTDATDWAEAMPEAGQVQTFGLDGSGEMYIANFEGDVFRIVAER